MRGIICVAVMVTLGVLEYALCDTPMEEMDKFIDECNVMIDTMQHCEEGWIDLEQEMIDSISSFSDRIVYTESLIIEEAGLILDMADRIVETEEILIDLIESCDCNDDIRRDKEFRQNIIHSTNANKSVVVYESVWGDNAFVDVRFDRCSAMDELIVVMDACIETFEVFNDDFLEILSYMDAAIQDMGDRIVDTECLIVNMSYQIGYMADEIVITEELMADMATSCCRHGDTYRPQVGNRNDRNNNVYIKKLSRAGKDELDDDLLSHCSFPDVAAKGEPLDVRSIRSKLQITSAHLTEGLARVLRHYSTLQGRRNVYMSSQNDNSKIPESSGSHSVGLRGSRQTEKGYDEQDDDGWMPCDTWWDPFCCAAEVCADIMAQMILTMGDGADIMTEICEDCIDEIGKLAGDIVQTEEYIIQMGYAIGDMSECIVVFIEQGLDLVSEFCPALLTDGGTWRPSYERLGSWFGDVRSESCENSIELYRRHHHKSGNTRLLSRRDIVQERRKQFLSLLDKLTAFQSSHTNGTNPFGEFSEMVNVMMQTAEIMADMMTNQMSLMTDMWDGLVDMSNDQASLDMQVGLLANDMTTLSEGIAGSEIMMLELDQCMRK